MDFSQTDVFLLALSALGFGMWLLIKGGDATVDAASAIAERFKIPSLLIGFTIVAFGTSLPELLVSINANFKGSAGIALGNVIGSNIANILLVIGAAAALFPVLADKAEIRNDVLMMLAASLALTYLMAFHIGLSSVTGVIMLAVLFFYVAYQYNQSRKNPAPHIDEDRKTAHQPLIKSVLILILGLSGVALGADVLVRGAIISAQILNVPDAVIGLTVIAVGTSLPELSTSITAALKKQSGIALGNVLGSNVFNILFILGTASALKSIPDDHITPQMAQIDIWVMMGITALFALLLLLRGKVGRTEGVAMLAAYAAYIGILALVYRGGV